MTDKQIIINGVDVSGCENFSCGICEEENKIPKTINHFTADCRMYPNCYYKQLKRKEQECERLMSTLTEIKEIAETISQPMGTGKSCNRVILAKQILQKISEVEDANSK